MMWRDISFSNPLILWLLLLIIPLIVWYILRERKSHVSFPLSNHHIIEHMEKKQWRTLLRHLLFFFQLLAFGFMVVALARPQSSFNTKNVTVDGIDIMIVIDISGSMLAEDFSPNRMEAAKEMALEFIDMRPNDRIGLVIFSGEAYTQCPMTSDHAMLKQLFLDIKTGMIEDGTAIGDGLATAVNSMKESKSASKVVVLLTDGENNCGKISPISAAEIAKLYNLKVYTIGLGKYGTAPFPVQGFFGKQYQEVDVDIDEELMIEIATMTGGKYFRAVNNEKLNVIYKEINELERTKINVLEYHNKKEEFLPLLIIALLLLMTEFLLRSFVLKAIT